MKQSKLFLKWSAVLLTTLSAYNVNAQYTKTGNDTVCVGEIKNYGVLLNAGSSYVWSITPAPGGNGTLTPAANLSTVTWTTAGKATLQVTETNTQGCDSIVSIIVIVNPALIAGTASADQTICDSTAPAALSATSPTGGDGTYSYQWESSTDAGATWTDISGAIALTYAPGILTKTTQYRLKQTGSCGTLNTNTVTITVNPAMVAGVANANQTICNNTVPAAIVAMAPAGGTGTYTYQWEFSTDGGVTWTDINGASALIYTPGALTQTTQYRLKQATSCGTVTTNAVTISVNPALVAGTATSNQTLCIGSVAATITATVPAGGNGGYTYQWEKSTDGGNTWTDVSGETSLNLIPGILTQTTVYRLKQTTSTCGVVTTNTVTITIISKPNTSPITHN